MAPWCCLEPYFKIDVAMLCAVQMDAMQTLEAVLNLSTLPPLLRDACVSADSRAPALCQAEKVT
eukprot:scaffold97731_cov23-Tisochrysis_lutea.AAC.2